jgi:hypothetical protein
MTIHSLLSFVSKNCEKNKLKMGPHYWPTKQECNYMYSHHLKTGQTGIQLVIFWTQFVFGLQMVKLAILFITIQKPDWFSDHST